MADQETAVYQRQGFGQGLAPLAPFGLLLVDFVNGFANPAQFGGGNIPQAIARSQDLLELARKNEWPVAHSRIVYAADGADENIFSAKIPGMGTLYEHDPASAIVESLAPAAGELVVRKVTPSAFFNTQLASWFTQRGVRTLLIGGCTTSGCVRASVVDAMCHGFRPFVIEDCTGDRALGPHEANLFDIGQKYGEVMELDAFVGLIRA